MKKWIQETRPRDKNSPKTARLAEKKKKRLWGGEGVETEWGGVEFIYKGLVEKATVHKKKKLAHTERSQRLLVWSVLKNSKCCGARQPHSPVHTEQPLFPPFLIFLQRFRSHGLYNARAISSQTWGMDTRRLRLDRERRAPANNTGLICCEMGRACILGQSIGD